MMLLELPISSRYNDLMLRIFSKHPDLFPEEFEHFDDFTIASSWERFISKIEAICRLWMADGPNNLLVCLFNFNMMLKVIAYMEYYFETKTGKSFDWNFTFYDLQLCFGVKELLLIAPQSASGVVLDSPEASRLLSAVAIAMSNSLRDYDGFLSFLTAQDLFTCPS
ncbi:hypothetical protein Ahy_A04g020042 [Arachis hypogaea]|uniref:Uncharacterized protein n=1 Tax=Arachis hypogaea TaxID=3818 RepID=A0A445DGZ8_ARAHY|nr:hypothetical protein Ahy_A04g020042 [Arachis hypogaea]